MWRFCPESGRVGFAFLHALPGDVLLAVVACWHRHRRPEGGRSVGRDYSLCVLTEYEYCTSVIIEKRTGLRGSTQRHIREQWGEIPAASPHRMRHSATVRVLMAGSEDE